MGKILFAEELLEDGGWRIELKTTSEETEPELEPEPEPVPASEVLY